MNENKRVVVAPSLLSADFSKLADETRKIQASGADWVHLDVMDGAFVSNLTFGPKLIADIRPHTSIPFDVHLMIENPQNLLEEFIKAGADAITFHWEASVHHHRYLERIRSAGKLTGLSLVPSTPVSVLEDILPDLDIVLIMTVNPGFGGQKFLPFCLEKIRRLVQIRQERGLKFRISVDGGINAQTYFQTVSAGADILVAGSAFFEASDPAELVRQFRRNPL